MAMSSVVEVKTKCQSLNKNKHFVGSDGHSRFYYLT